MTTTALATLTDVEAVVSRTATVDEAAFIVRLIELVSGKVAGRTKSVSWTPVTGDTATVTPHDGLLLTPKWPVTSISSITIGGNVIDPTLYTPTERGRVQRTSPLALIPDSTFGIFTRRGWPINGEFGWPPLPTTIVYNHGFTEIPEDISLVVAEVVAAKWLGGERQANGVISEAIADYKVGFYKNEPVGAWLPEHKEVLDSYRRSKVASMRLS